MTRRKTNMARQFPSGSFPKSGVIDRGPLQQETAGASPDVKFVEGRVAWFSTGKGD